MKMLPAAERLATPWKNGGGTTWEVAAFPPNSGLDSFGWRISVAEVASAGPFSDFGDVDRILTVLEGRLELRFLDQGCSVLLDPGQSHAFAGNTAIEGRPMGGLVRDLNVMVRRGAWLAQVAADRPEPKSGALVFAVATRAGTGFAALDAALLDDNDNLPKDFSGHFISLRQP